VIRAAARRAWLPLTLVGFTVLAVAALAALTGSPFERAVALGLYAVGSFMAIVGFALGSRSLFQSARQAKPDESGGFSAAWETQGVAAVLILIGLILVAAGVAVDPHARLM
jgi:hypothetical protein